MAPLPYVELIEDRYGTVFLDRDGYGHRAADYALRWQQLGRERSGWNQNADGSFVSQTPLGKRGHPIDPSRVYEPASAGSGTSLAYLAIAVGAAYAWLRMRSD